MSARVAGSGTIRLGPPVLACRGEDPLGGVFQRNNSSGLLYPPNDLRVDTGPAMGIPLYGPAAIPVVPTEVMEISAPYVPGFGPSGFYGTPNNGSNWGLTQEVSFDGTHQRARWTFAFPAAKICAAVVGVDGGLVPATGFYDGHPFTDPLLRTDSFYSVSIEINGATVATGVQVQTSPVPQSFGSTYMVAFAPVVATSADLVFDAVLGNGGFDGFHIGYKPDFTNFLLYGATIDKPRDIAIAGSGSRRDRPA